MTQRTLIRLVPLMCCLLWSGIIAADQLPDLRFTEETFDIGCVGIDFKVYHNFEMVNHGADTIHIDTVTAHCDCTEVRFIDSVLAPGDTARGLMIFNTANMYGPVEKDIRVYSSDRKSPYTYLPYLAHVGQWLYKVEPKPVNVFFLPGQKSRPATFLNHEMESITLKDIDLDDDIVDIRTLRAQADTGESLELEITPKANLTPGTHNTNFTALIELPDGTPPLRITIPIRVVKY